MGHHSFINLAFMVHVWPSFKNIAHFLMYFFAGMLGFFGAVGYGAYAYKRRGQMSTSIYLMRLRVMAQSVVVGAITLGAAFTMFKNMNKEKK